MLLGDLYPVLGPQVVAHHTHAAVASEGPSCWKDWCPVSKCISGWKKGRAQTCRSSSVPCPLVLSLVLRGSQPLSLDEFCLWEGRWLSASQDLEVPWREEALPWGCCFWGQSWGPACFPWLLCYAGFHCITLFVHMKSCF